MSPLGVALMCFVLLFACGTRGVANASRDVTGMMLTQAVTTLPLTGTWKFKADPENLGKGEKWFSTEFDDSHWKNIQVPGTWNEGQDVGVKWDYSGPAWYRRKLDVPQSWEGHHIRLRFLAVYLISDVWLNGKYLGNHKGGYTAFSFDVSNVLNFAKHSENVIVVRADNTKRAFQVPGASIDWWNCGGITREVFLEKTPDVYLTKLRITPVVLDSNSQVRVHAWFGSKHNTEKAAKVRAEVFWRGKAATFDAIANGAPAESVDDCDVVVGAGGADCTITLDVERPRLWSPDDPELYELRLSWQISDEKPGIRWFHRETFGIRKIEVRGTELFLNGEKIWLQGIAIHQDYAGMGSAVTHAAQRSDLERIKKLNANFVRLGHYPFHPYSLDVCDEIGLLVWSEVPVWQNSPKELADEKMYREWVKPQITEMIDQQYNHPSVIFWSVANEISRAWKEPPETVAYVKRATDYVRSLDSTRLVSYASAADTGSNTWQFLDVIAKPLHYGWFHSPNVYDLDSKLAKIHNFMPDKPILAIELCGMSYPDNHTGYSQNTRFSVEYHDKLLRVDMQRLMMRKDFVCGVTLWTLADLKGGREKGTYGILNRKRQQIKHIYETIKNLYSGDAKLLIIDQKTGYRSGEQLQVELWSFSTRRKPIDACKVSWWIRDNKGRAAEGAFSTDIAADSAQKLRTVSWKIPSGDSGFHSLFCVLDDKNGTRLFANDYYFDVDTPEKPAILWVKVVDAQEKPVSGAVVEFDGFTRITDEFGRVPFLLNTGKYALSVTYAGTTRQIDVHVQSGKTTEIVCNMGAY